MNPASEAGARRLEPEAILEKGGKRLRFIDHGHVADMATLPGMSIPP